uniref:Nuclear factor of activated T cells 3b n=1 Tax=Maylandia zebra TaxID=106582 RepID=A0A3P9DEB7_9CICH
MLFSLLRFAGPDLDVRTFPSSAQALVEQPFIQELQSSPSCFTSDPHVGYQLQGPQYGAQVNPRAFDCPSIQITSIAPNNHLEPDSSQDPRYRDPALCPSPCSSLSSRSWISDLSSCESFSHTYDDVEGELPDAARLAMGSPLGSPFGSPGCDPWPKHIQMCMSESLIPLCFLRPSSRPTSPCGKRRHSSADPHARSPSPHHSPSPTPGASPRGSVTDETWVGSPAGALGPLLMCGFPELDIPSKTRRTSGSQLVLLAGQVDSSLESFQDPPAEEGREQEGLAELFLQVPSHFTWNKPKPGNAPLFRTSSPPPLDWPLPSQYDQCELKVEVQPKSYHRAHYETEGSRGSIKAAAGHPIVKLHGCSEQRVGLVLFIGTADDRYIRPHPFYQVHRVTGKTVTTMCQEKIMDSIKVLEIPLLPENDMSASIDCAGILKLRNADIELKKGETDIGRKNTRVRVVFRVAIPQPDGQILWLQTASIPVECSQRSGQELPQVDSFSPASGSVEGGQELLISGPNISAQSRVVFMERGPGKIALLIYLKAVRRLQPPEVLQRGVPVYNKKATSPVQVQFYVTNGKRRKSVTQSFTYLPGVRHHGPPAVATVKQERWEPDRISQNPPGFSLTASRNGTLSPDVAYYGSCDLLVQCGPQSNPHLHHPHSSAPLQTPLMYPQTSSVPLQVSLPSQTTLIPLQTSVMAPQITTIPPPASSVPLQTFSVPPHSSPGGSQRDLSLSPRSTFVTPANPQKDSVLAGPGEALIIKQEPEEQPPLGSLGLQEITLDDGRKLDVDPDLLLIKTKKLLPVFFTIIYIYIYQHNIQM